ncbi:putative esterase [Ancylostoma ceylanicum]|uniref:Putative esterase n=1 Tax=Ancylostoma ceylanicum TaxID=53326 RepID=A0A0D6L582_9BILA|nr:putative esterase [Ancylostoma ceylanicum]
MKTLFFAVLLVFQIHTANTQTHDSDPLIIGSVATIQSRILNEERKLNIYLPDQYDASRTYPVLYLLDGSMNEDFMHISGLVQYFNLQFGMPETIVVGIVNRDRKSDFTFATDHPEMKEMLPTAGNSENFIRYIEEEIQPFIDRTYPTTGTKYLVGQSLGGLLASEILLKKPHLFTHYLIVSPSLWWDDQSLLNKSGEYLSQHDNKPPYVYISVGGDEHPVMKKMRRNCIKS